jgi:hypothetical protein
MKRSFLLTLMLLPLLLTGCMRSALTKPPQEGSVAAAAIDVAAVVSNQLDRVGRAAVAVELRSRQAMGHAESLMDTARVEVAWTLDTARDEMEGTGAETRNLMARLRASLNTWDTQMTQLATTSRKCLVAITACLCAALLALAVKWIRRKS